MHGMAFKVLQCLVGFQPRVSSEADASLSRDKHVAVFRRFFIETGTALLMCESLHWVGSTTNSHSNCFGCSRKSRWFRWSVRERGTFLSHQVDGL